MKFAKIVFRVAAIWGVLVITPLYFMIDLIGRKDPPPITHPAFSTGSWERHWLGKPRFSSSRAIRCAIGRS
jgi:hypothetical protein